MKNGYTSLYESEHGKEIISDVLDDYFINNDGGIVAAKYVYHVINDCKTEGELKVAENMFIAIFGWSFDSLIRDAEKYKGEHYNDGN